MATTAGLGITLLEVGQGLPEVTVNEALIILDALVPYPIIQQTHNFDPDNPIDPIIEGGIYYINPTEGTVAGAWVGHNRELAINIGTAASPVWHFVPTEKSMLGYIVKSDATTVGRLRQRTSTTSDTWANF